jgi:predicted TIM-barrel fold metal-dependent hydrolase
VLTSRNVYDVAMRIITLEEHITTPEIQKAASEGPASKFAPNAFFQSLQAKLLDVGESRLAEMDAHGIDLQVLSLATNPISKLEPSAALALATDSNEALAAAVNAHPTRFSAWATVALQEPEKAAAEFERCIQKLRFKGLMVNGTTNGLFLDHPKFTPIFEAAQALEVPIYLHPAPPPAPVMEAYFSGLPEPLGPSLSTGGWGWHVETGMHALRLMISGVFDRFPKLKIILGHLGENLPFSIARAEGVFTRGAKNLKRPVDEYFQEHFYLTTSGYFTLPPFLCALQVVGADHLLFSVDYPFSSIKEGRDFLDRLPVSREDMEKIAHGNAEKLLKF